MKNLNLIGTVLLSGAMLAGMTGCHHPKTMVTHIPDNDGTPQPRGDTLTPGNPGQLPPPIVSNPVPTEPGVIDYKEFGKLFDDPNRVENPDKFKEDAIHFDFDSSVIRPSEESRLQDVANYFKDNPRMEGLIIEGNCDERGTEKYNLSLGERRSLAAREYLVNLGVKPERIKTVTFGKDRPVATGHDETAWRENRRDEFVLVTAK